MADLSHAQQEALARIIRVLYGPNDALLDRKYLYNQHTVDAVERAWSSAMLCDERLRVLASSLVGGHALLAKGWLRKVIMKSSNELRKDGPGHSVSMACRVQASAVWKTEILMTLY